MCLMAVSTLCTLAMISRTTQVIVTKGTALQTVTTGEEGKATPIVIGNNGETELFTDEKGHMVTCPILFGTYVVIESTTPHNMETIKPFEVTITENHPTEPQIWRIFIDREFSAKLRVIKKDADTKQTVLIPNTEFKIFNMDTNEYVTMITIYPSKVEHTSFSLFPHPR